MLSIKIDWKYIKINKLFYIVNNTIILSNGHAILAINMICKWRKKNNSRQCIYMLANDPIENKLATWFGIHICVIEYDYEVHICKTQLFCEHSSIYIIIHDVIESIIHFIL